MVSRTSDSKKEFTTGKIKLESEEIPYAFFPHSSEMEDILRVMVKEWKLDLPKIMLVIVSGNDPFISWDSNKEQANFVNGLIKGSNATSMWIFTNALNIGISKIIGSAFQDNYEERISQICFRHAKEKKVVSKLPVIGLCRDTVLTYHNQFETPETVMHLNNEGNNLDEQKFNLNPHHTHFLITQNKSFTKDSSNRFLLRLLDTLRLKVNVEPKLDKSVFPSSPVPIIAILIQGNLNSIHYIFAHLKRNLPVLVIKGSGGLAEIFAYAYYETRRSFQKIKDKDYVETILKKGLNNKITSVFPGLKDNKMARNLLCGRILECIECSEPPGMKQITVLNVLDLTCHMEDLPHYLIQVLFKFGKSEGLSFHEELRKDLQLMLDWNCAELALTKVFYKDPTFIVENDMFEQALLSKKREQFVSIFLDNGFDVHKYLDAQRLIKLFEDSLKDAFFQEVCWEGILGYRRVIKLDYSFIDSDLNWMIESLIGISLSVSAEELDASSREIFDKSYSKEIGIDVAKRRALLTLVIWALVSKRDELAMILWQHADYPIMTALTASLILHKMKAFVTEKKTEEEISELSKKFASMAVGVFDLCYSDLPSKAYDSLNVRMEEYAGLSLIDMASLSRNRTFVSHPCCQKWLTNKFMGKLKIRELSWGFMSFTVYIKVILCAFFVFPMYLWVRFKESSIHEFVGGDEYDKHDPYYIPDPQESKIRVPREEAARSHLLKYHYPPLWQMILWMWSAPITKFWVSNIFYMIYLALFSLAVLHPSCGNIYLDSIVCIWTLLIAVDATYQLFSIHKSFPNTPLFGSSLEIIYILFFVLFYYLLRVLNHESFRDPYTGKVLICLGLIYFFYRMIFIYLPISSTMGPLLYRAKEMITVDFVNFLKLVAFVLTGNAIAMQAILYPDYPLISELFRKSFHKAFIAFFMTPVGELVETEPNCVKWEQKPADDVMCRVSDYIDGTCSSGIKFWPYVIVFQYILLMKLILSTILFALFAATGARIDAEMDSIWKFQRYKLIINFSNTLRLPPPLNIFSILIIIFNFIVRCCKGDILFIRKKEKKDEMMDDEKREKFSSSLDYSYWRKLANDYLTLMNREKEESEYVKEEIDLISNLRDDLNMKEMLIFRAQAQIKQLENDILYTHAHLETLKYRAKGKEDMKEIVRHSLSRESPYPRTTVHRFPVPDKYVPWEVTWLRYQPLFYTMPKKEFAPALQPYVDNEIIMNVGTKKSELPVIKWNMESVSADGIYRNRKSWIKNNNNEPITYRLDFDNLPRNPMGRTGLRGKGALPRWGPNHNLFVIITRWKAHKGAKDDEELIDVSEHLEFVETWFMKRKDQSLPGGFVWSENKYEAIQSCFIIEESSSEPWQTSEDMIKFFKDHAVGEPGAELTAGDFTSKMVCCGYMDDQMNTDQAWKEVELWHLHYNVWTNLYRTFKANVRWRLLSEDVFIQLPYGQTTLLQDAIRPLNAKIAQD